MSEWWFEFVNEHEDFFTVLPIILTSLAMIFVVISMCIDAYQASQESPAVESVEGGQQE